MKRALKIAAIVLGGVVALVLAIGVLLYNLPADPFAPVYAENCAVCHGEALEGAAQGPALVSRTLASGDAVPQLVASIGQGFPERGMPGWAGTLSESQVRGLAILIAERRAHREMTDFKVDKPLAIPTGAVDSELVRFRIETVASGIDPKPFSIAPLPDGSLLVTEKTKGIRIVSPDGTLSAPIIGTPETSGFGVTVRGLDYRIGALLDVAPHPDYARNGWIYLVHTDLCAECRNGGKLVPTTMNRLVRGRIARGRWVDEEVIWSVPQAFYTPTPDLAAGGRLAFSRDGHVFVSVGIKGAGEQFGIQDLATPYGKIHRVRDDGRIPEDNPFVARAGAMPSIWTYGHRSPQGLELDPQTGELWGTEMGQRGGDEVNHLRPGRNYGWPLTSRGLKYDGTPVDYGKELGITLDLRTIEQPVVDLTPSPAVSSFVIYQGAEFPEWQGNFIVGSLKATELYRFVIDGDQLVHSETLLTDLARIRDVAVGPHGELYLLLEHASGARIVRLVPVRGA